MRAWSHRVAALAIVCIAVAGCTLLFPSPVKIEKALLDEVPVDLPHRESRGATVLVLPPETAPLYDTMQMAYSTQAHEVAYFSRHEWAETPSQMLYPLLVKTLENTRSFRAVLIPPYTGGATYELSSEIIELTQEFTSRPPFLVLSLRFWLIDYGTDRIVAANEISVREPMQPVGSNAGVIAANDATAKALRQMAVFVLDKTD